jgi:hypothetical protein
MDNSVVYHARYGDYSKVAYLAPLEGEGDSVAICCAIDPEKKYEAPNPRFACRERRRGLL